MSLTIGHMHVRASVPARLRTISPSFDRIARTAFGPACARELDARWPAGSQVCRIRRLHVQLRLSPRDLDEGRLAAAWADAFCRALAALVQQPGHADVVVADDRADWCAAVLIGVLEGRASVEWAYEEFGAGRERSVAELALAVLTRFPDEIVAVLRAVTKRGAGPRLFAALGEVGCERVCLAASGDAADAVVATDFDDVLAIGALAVSHGGGAPSGQPARALAIHVAETERGGSVASPVRILGVLRALARLSEAPESSPESGWVPPIDTALARIAGAIDPVAVAERRALASIRAVADDAERTAERVALAELLAALAPATSSPSALDSAAAVAWRRSDRAGVLLLVDTVIRLGWLEAVRRSAFGRDHGTRAPTYVLAGVALSLLGTALADPVIDPAAAVFAGWTDEPRPGAFAAGLAAAGVQDRRDLLAHMLPTETDHDEAALSWDATFACLAAHAVRAFAERIRGFRKASHGFVVERLLATAGRIAIDDARVRVVLAPNPYWVALHLAGLDHAIDYVGWLGGRRLEIELEGL